MLEAFGSEEKSYRNALHRIHQAKIMVPPFRYNLEQHETVSTQIMI